MWSVILIEFSISSLGCETCELVSIIMLPVRVESIVVVLLLCPLLRILDIFCYLLMTSRTMWLYLLNERSEVSSVIESLFNEIKNQFSTSIRVLRTDYALEYVKKDVSFFVPKMVLSIRHLILIHPNKMELPKENTRHILNVAGILKIHI